MNNFKKVTRKLLALTIAAVAVLAIPLQAAAAPRPEAPVIQTNRKPVVGDIEVYNLTDSTFVKHDALKANKSYEVVYMIDIDERVKNLEFYASQIPTYLYKGQDLTLKLETSATAGKTNYARAKEITLYSEDNLYLRPNVTVRTDIRRYNWYEPQLWDDETRSYQSYYNFHKTSAIPAGRYYEIHVRIDTFKI